jgi:hypothetical protein
MFAIGSCIFAARLVPRSLDRGNGGRLEGTMHFRLQQQYNQHPEGNGDLQ